MRLWSFACSARLKLPARSTPPSDCVSTSRASSSSAWPKKLVPGDPAVGIKKALKPMPAGGEQPVLKDLARGLIAKWRKSKGEPWVREALVGAEGKAEPVSWIEPRLTSASNIEDEARAVSHATAERYRRMEIPGPPAVSRAGEAAVA